MIDEGLPRLSIADGVATIFHCGTHDPQLFERMSGGERAFLTAQAMPVESFAASGAFEAVVGADAFDTTVNALVHTAAGLAPQAAQDTRRSLDEIAAGRFVEAALRERETRSLLSQDFAEGRAARAERRPPRFTGR